MLTESEIAELAELTNWGGVDFEINFGSDRTAETIIEFSAHGRPHPFTGFPDNAAHRDVPLTQVQRPEDLLRIMRELAHEVICADADAAAHFNGVPLAPLIAGLDRPPFCELKQLDPGHRKSA